MKSKILVLIVAVAAITLSFSFASRTNAKQTVLQTKVSSNQAGPAGGFISEDKF